MENRSCGTRKVTRWQSANSRISVSAGTHWLDSEPGDALGDCGLCDRVHHMDAVSLGPLALPYDSVPCVCWCSGSAFFPLTHRFASVLLTERSIFFVCPVFVASAVLLFSACFLHQVSCPLCFVARCLSIRHHLRRVAFTILPVCNRVSLPTFRLRYRVIPCLVFLTRNRYP